MVEVSFVADTRVGASIPSDLRGVLECAGMSTCERGSVSWESRRFVVVFLSFLGALMYMAVVEFLEKHYSACSYVRKNLEGESLV